MRPSTSFRSLRPDECSRWSGSCRRSHRPARISSCKYLASSCRHLWRRHHRLGSRKTRTLCRSCRCSFPMQLRHLSTHVHPRNRGYRPALRPNSCWTRRYSHRTWSGISSQDSPRCTSWQPHQRVRRPPVRLHPTNHLAQPRSPCPHRAWVDPRLCRPTIADLGCGNRPTRNRVSSFWAHPSF